MVKITKLLENRLEWPEDGDNLETITIQCAGKAFLEYQALVAAGDDMDAYLDDLGDDDDEELDENDKEKDKKMEAYAPPSVDLFSLTEAELEEVDYYQVLHLPYWPHLTKDDIKKAYRKASLKYHPDKSGRDEEDAVFLKVKAAYETLSTNKQAYDSTEMHFDESLPDEDPLDFFKEYGPVFERNVFFDARLLPPDHYSQPTSGKKNNRHRKKKKKNDDIKPPSLGDENTPIEDVHRFYDYWTHFTTWRDFGLQAARELETEDHLENAESRYEKRWYQKQIDTHARKLKQKEQARITTLVERAMAVDPRLVQERKRLIQEKEEKQRQKEQEAKERERKALEAQQAEERRMEEEKQQKAQEKLAREKEKKMLRKTKQVFRKLVGEALASLKEREHALEEEVDLICSELNREQLIKLNTNLEAKKETPADVCSLVKKRYENLKNKLEEEEEDNTPVVVKVESTVTNAKIPFTKEELAALAKGVKKFPSGGGNRWESIATYINNSCRPQIPRTKEECIETFNQNKITNKPTPATPTPAPTPAVSAPKDNGAAPAPAEAGDNGGDTWTEEQDQLLQDGLAKFPASMDKNERWTSIAKGIPGKTKKNCVQRFKAIRDAIKNKKQ